MLWYLSSMTVFCKACFQAPLLAQFLFLHTQWSEWCIKIQIWLGHFIFNKMFNVFPLFLKFKRFSLCSIYSQSYILSLISFGTPTGLSCIGKHWPSFMFPDLHGCSCPWFCFFHPANKYMNDQTSVLMSLPFSQPMQVNPFVRFLLRPIPVSNWTVLSMASVWLESHHNNTANTEVCLSAIFSGLRIGHWYIVGSQ